MQQNYKQQSPPYNSNEEENSEEGSECTDLKREVLPEEGGTAAAIKGPIPPSNSNANEKRKVHRREGLQQQ